MKWRLLIVSLVFSVTLSAQENIPHPDKDKMQWFQDAKLGIFIHWGIYAVKGIDESWSFFNGYISHEDYLKQLDGFTAENYHPEEWARLIRESGARYTVITSRHHDGVALWDTQYGNLNVPDNTPAGRDVLTPFVEAARQEGLKVGLYYSLPDWSHPDYTHFLRDSLRYKDAPDRWQKFLDYYQGQLRELMNRYDPALWWFDGDWEHSAEEWQAAEVRKILLDHNPEAIINSRLTDHGDYATPEQGLPLVRPEEKYWELCMTMNDSWGFQRNDHNYKTPYQVIRILADVISMGGNLLLDIGPKADGTIPEEQVHILKELGKWTSKHQEAIFNTRQGIPASYFYGPSTLSKKGDVLYLFITGKPNGPIVLKGVKNKINRIRIAGDGTKLSHQVLMKQYWSEIPGIVYIDIPDYVLDEYITVVAVQLDGKIDLHRQ